MYLTQAKFIYSLYINVISKCISDLVIRSLIEPSLQKEYPHYRAIDIVMIIVDQYNTNCKSIHYLEQMEDQTVMVQRLLHMAMVRNQMP